MSITESNHTLTPNHRRMLYEESGIAPEVAAERGYYSTRTRAEIPDCFKGKQRRLGLVIPSRTSSGERRDRLRPDRPRPDKGKYEQPLGVACTLDVHPRNLEYLRDSSVDLWIVEGEKKGDALTSRGECAVSIPGVWNWQRDGEMLPDWDYIALEGRTVYVCFDSDTWRNPNVALALARHVDALMERGARVLTVILEDAPDGSKVGADDFLASGGTVDDLKARSRELAPEDIVHERLSRDARLRLALEELERQISSESPEGRAGHTDLDVKLSLCKAAPRGKVVEKGVYVELSWGTMQLDAKISRQTLAKSLDRIEATGFIVERVPPQKRGQSGGFILRAKVDHYREGQRSRGESNESVTKGLPSSLVRRGPRLMWSDPGYKGRRGTVSGTRKVRQAPAPKPRPAVKRMGKEVSHLVDTLLIFGRTLHRDALYDAMHPDKPPEKRRPRDLTRRKNPETGKGRDGAATVAQDLGIVSVEGDDISLTPDWLERLEDAREIGGEIEAERIARKKMKDRRAAYHNRHKRPSEAKSKPTPEGIAAVRASREKRRAHLDSRPPDTLTPEAPLSPLAVAVRDYLERRPCDARQPAGWIANTLWAHSLYPGKPTLEETSSAIAELGGAAYLDALLRRVQGAHAA